MWRPAGLMTEAENDRGGNMSGILNMQKIAEADSDDLAAVKEELRQTKELCRKLDAIIENTPDGIYVTDGDANAIRINPAFSRISGLKRENMLGVNHRDLEKNKVVYRSSALMVVRERKPVTIIHEYLPTNKQALVTSIPVFDKDGNIELIVSSTRDLTELNELKNKLAVEREQRLKFESQIEVIRAKMLSNTSLIAVDKKTLNLLYMAARVASVDSTVMINGETGVGKEEIAKYIHNSSPRAKESFIAINCGAIPEKLVESELFGYEKGAFTGARATGKPGMLELANKGTIFLDEVGELPLDTQTKLLRAIETRKITRVGGSDPVDIDIRIVAATNRNLQEMVDNGTFRADLYYRLNVVPIYVPPLRERRDDIVPMINYFLGEINKKYGLNKNFSNAAYRILYEYAWLGNVRELKNMVERAVVTSEGDFIQEPDLPVQQREDMFPIGPMQGMTFKERMERIEFSYLKAAYERFGSVRSAAAALEMPVSTFVRKRKDYERRFESDSILEHTIQ